MTDYGDAAVGTYIICISSGQTGGAPSGDKAFLSTPVSIKGSERWDMKIKHSAGNFHYAGKKGTYTPKITIQDMVVLKYVTSRTVSFNNIMGFFRSLQSIGDSPAYLWVRHGGDVDNVELGFLGEVTTDYLRGYITDINWELVKGTYYIKQLNWEGVNN